MKRVLRMAVNGAAGLSLLLAAALIVVWASRSFPRQAWIPLTFHLPPMSGREMYVGGSGNILFFESITYSRPVVGPKSSDPAAAAFIKQFGGPQFHINALRFKTLREPLIPIRKDGRLSMEGMRTSFGVPYGFLLVLFLALPAWRWLPPLTRHVRRRMAKAPGACRNCGYDLRATPNQCPECGVVPTSPA